jgi:hypothetical protein
VSLRRFGQEFLAFESPQSLDACPQQSAKEVGRHTFGMASETETRPLLQRAPQAHFLHHEGLCFLFSHERLRLYRPVSRKEHEEKRITCSSAGSRERNPRPTLEQGPTLEQATPKKRSGRYVMEIRDAAGASLLLTGADWTDTERDLATLNLGRLAGQGRPWRHVKTAFAPRDFEYRPPTVLLRKTGLRRFGRTPRFHWIQELENCHFCCIDGEDTSKLGIETS